MWEIIKNLMAAGTSILLTTQYLEEADQLADRIVVIDGGKVIAEGTATELKRKVGKDRLELTFKDSTTLARVKQILSADIIDTDNKEYTATVIVKDTSVDVKRTLDLLAKEKVTIQSMAIHKPTLDDVFLSLTGKQKETKREGKK
jgi:ABC-2 type transport system ATP-binding protein